ncbi:radical SAM/SPASM domain-containing protein [Marinoscillum sp. MHG1-6]|uniref:radical SAM/SPASM domain-containing protein n=1 Tax=Marinoscillum sp. MHG1-6 TaxID=2959627 RepID=UPI002157AFEC|nr:radical SAM/SPASM domain-containing protein [Marinoscillum sp. MHG1-6]
MYINLADTLNLASKLTFKRLNNAMRILTSFYASRWSGDASMRGLPISLSVEPTTACNLRCPECPSGLRSFTRPTGKIAPHTFQQVIDELHETLCYLIFYFQGEPYLHPEFLEMIRYAADKRIYTATSTNAHFLSDEMARQTVESGLDRLIISIDGATQATYEAYRKEGELEKVLEGTANIIKWKKQLKSSTPHVVWQYLVVKPNEHEIDTIQQMAREYGVDHLAFKTAQIYDYEQGNELIPTDERYSRYKQQADGTYALKHKVLDECWKMWHSAVVTWDGKVVPCCFDKDAQHTLGSVKESSFENIWHSEAYHRFRDQLFTSRGEIEMCKNCTEGAKVWA